MTVPLVVLAGLAVVGGLLQLPFTPEMHFLEDWLHPVLGENEAVLDVSSGTKVVLAAIAVLTGLVGIAARRRRLPAVSGRPAVEPDVFAEGWYYDRSISAFVGGPGGARASKRSPRSTRRSSTAP